jgi:hypothetical protein
MALKALVSAAIRGTLNKALSHGGSVEQPFTFGVGLQFEDGSGAGQASKMFSARRSINASSNDDIDLSGALVNDMGDPVVFTAIKAILVRHVSGGNAAVIGGAATNPFVGPFGAGTHTIAVPVGGEMLIANPTAGGWTVTAGTGDLLRIANGAGSTLVVDVTIIGI